MILRVHFDAPGFFLNDPRVRVRVDNRVLYDGSFKDGFDVSVSVAPGRHVLETAIRNGMAETKQRIELPLDESSGYREVPEVHAKLTYSRISGNFDRRVSLSVKR